MKKTSLIQTALLFRKAMWLFVFVSLVFSKDITSADFFAGFSDHLTLTTAESKNEMPKQHGQNQSLPFSNSGEEKADWDIRYKNVDETIYSRSRRVVSEKAKALNSQSYAVIKIIPQNDSFPRNFPNPSNTCFASFHKFSVF